MGTTISKNLQQVWVNPFSLTASLEERIFFLLRLGVMGCYVGHGFWGVVGKETWIPFFKIFFISENASHIAMPVIGIIDITIGLLMFLRPTRALLLWVSAWALFTAFLRPSAGFGMSEFFERAGNYGIPLAFLLLYNLPDNSRSAFERLRPFPLSPSKLLLLEWFMRITVFLLLAGHGGLAFFMNSPVIVKHFSSIGIPADTSALQLFGLFEMILASIALIWPRIRGLMLFILIYKLTTELLFPITGHARDFFETFERMGDYVAPLILWNIYRFTPILKRKIH